MGFVHPIVHVEELTVSSSEDTEVVCLTQELEIGVGDALGISLSEVHARYFWDSDNGEDWVEELVVVQNYRDLDNPNTTQTLEYTKDKYNVKIRKQRVSPEVPPTTYKD
jgi:hypothetical protein